MVRRLLVLVSFAVLCAAPVFADPDAELSVGPNQDACTIVGPCQKCPTSKQIAEQVVENLDARPRPEIIRCQKRPHPVRGMPGLIGRCLVRFPAVGTPLQ